MKTRAIALWGRRDLAVRAVWICLMAGIIRSGAGATGPQAEPQAHAVQNDQHMREAARLQIGIAPGTWQGLNRNDATAAISAWAKTILARRDSAISVQTTLFDSADELADALKNGRIECASMLADQFFALDATLRPNEIFVAVNQRTFTDQYVLLVHQTSGIRQLSDLKGRKCIIPSSARMSLALPWLDTLLASQGGAEGFLAEVRYVSKPSMAVLPVFFRQVDACLITQKAFEVSEELNPQLRKDLHVVVLSPEVVPSVFFFTRGRASIAREQLEPAIVGLHETPEGQQVLTVFQCERMVQCRIERLEDTRRLVEEHQRLNRSKIVRLSGVSIAPATAHENP